MFNTKFSRWHLRFKIKCCRKAKEHNFWRKNCALEELKAGGVVAKSVWPFVSEHMSDQHAEQTKGPLKTHTGEKAVWPFVSALCPVSPMIKLSDQTHSSLHETHKELICFVITFCWTWCVSMTNSCNNGLCQEHPGVALQVSQRGRLDIIELTLVRFLTQNKNACNEGCHVKSLQIYPQRISVLGGGQQ